MKSKDMTLCVANIVCNQGTHCSPPAQSICRLITLPVSFHTRLNFPCEPIRTIVLIEPFLESYTYCKKASQTREVKYTQCKSRSTY